MHLMFHRSLCLVLFITVAAVSLAGCSKASDDGFFISGGDTQTVFTDGRPSIGPTVEDETVTNVDIDSQTRVSVKIHSGSIKITRGSQNQLQVIENWQLKGPATRERLSQLLGKRKKTLETTTTSITIEREAAEEFEQLSDGELGRLFTDIVMPLYRQTVQMELIVPESITQIYIDAQNASVTLSGFDEMSSISLSLGRGTVHAEQCSSKRLTVSVDEGDIHMKDISAFGTYECGKGNILLSGIVGTVELKSVSGNTLIEKTEGKLNCDISTGTLTVKDCVMGQDSTIYASHGDISADFEAAGIAGGCKIRAATGDISVNLPEKADGWSLAVRSTKGRIKNKMVPMPDTLESVSSGEVHGDVRGGGPLLDIYVDNGDVLLQ